MLKDDPTLPLPNAKYSMTLTKPSVPELERAWKRAMRYLGVLMAKVASTADKHYLIVDGGKGLRVGAKVFKLNVSIYSAVINMITVCRMKECLILPLPTGLLCKLWWTLWRSLKTLIMCLNSWFSMGQVEA